MPPTANRRLASVRGRLIKTYESRMFEKNISIYMTRLGSGLFEYRRIVKEWIDVGYCLKVEFSFNWPKEKLITNLGFPKKLDVSNRIKESEDAISDILAIDDKYFFEVTAKKIPKIQDHSDFNVCISPTKWGIEEETILSRSLSHKI